MAQAIIPIAAAVVGGVAGSLLAPKAPKMNTPPAITRNQAAEQAAQSKEFRKRQGAAANMMTGQTGAEAPSPGAKALLGQ